MTLNLCGLERLAWVVAPHGHHHSQGHDRVLSPGVLLAMVNRCGMPHFPEMAKYRPFFDALLWGASGVYLAEIRLHPVDSRSDVACNQMPPSGAFSPKTLLKEGKFMHFKCSNN